MAKARGTGLLMVWVDIAPEHASEFNRSRTSFSNL